MFEREVAYEAYFLPGPGELPTTESIDLAMAWLIGQPGDPLVLLHAKKMIANNRRLAELVGRSRVRVEAPRTHDFAWPGGSVLAPWASEDVLTFIDDQLDDLVRAVCVIGWTPGQHDRWIVARGAVNLRGGTASESVEAIIDDPVVRIAIDRASRSINHNNALVQSEDKAYVVLTLQELVRGGHRFDVDQLVTHAMATGWTGEEVRRLEEYAVRVLDGRHFQLRSAYGPGSGACARWEAEAHEQSEQRSDPPD